MTAYEKVRIEYKFIPFTGLKIGAGFGKYGIVDQAYLTRKNSENETIYSIPGTSVKGRIRSTYKKYSHLFPFDLEKVENALFGKIGQPGWAHFSDLIPSVNEDVLLGTQPKVSIDRFRRNAKSKSFRMEEYAQLVEGNFFKGEIEGYRLTERDFKEKDLYALLFSLLTTTHFGGDKSTGYGKGKTEITRLIINEKTIDISNINKTIQQQLSRGE